MTQANNVAIESSQINSSGVLQVAGGGTGATTSTGSGAVVLATSPTLVTPALGTPASGTLTNCTGLPVGGISATGTPSSTTYLRGDSTWSSITGMVYPGAGIANSTGSAWGTSYTTTGSGTVVALATSPSFTTPNIGAASGTSLSLSSTIGASNFSGSSSGTNTGDQTNISGSAGSVAGSGITGSRGIPKAAMPAGTVLQVVSSATTSTTSTTSSTMVSTGFSATITPTSSSSTILILIDIGAVGANQTASFCIARGSTLLGRSAAGTGVNGGSVLTINAAGGAWSSSLSYLDSPATTSATTYTLYFASDTGTVTVNKRVSDSYIGATTTITLMEVAA